MLSTQNYNMLMGNLEFVLDNGWKDIINRLYNIDKLNEFLEITGLSYLLESNSYYHPLKKGKILIVGGSMIKTKDVIRALKTMGIDKDRVELCLDYKEAKKFDLRKLQYNEEYSLILAGPMPHSGTGKGEYSSKLLAMEGKDGFPPVVKLGSNCLKITKSEIEKKIQYSVDQGYIAI